MGKQFPKDMFGEPNSLVSVYMAMVSIMNDDDDDVISQFVEIST